MNATEAAYVKELEGKVSTLGNQVDHLTEQLEWFKRHLFGQRSEKHVDGVDASQLYLDGLEPTSGPSKEKEKQVKSHMRKQRRKGQDKVTIPKDMPVKEIVLDVSPEEKVCPETNKPLVKIGEEVTHKLAYRPGSYYLKRIIRPKYGLPSGKGVICVPLPDSILTRCLADESLLADIIVKKFADHLPLYRICEGLARQGIGISRQLLSQWVLALGKALEPLHQEMYKRILASGNVFIDESPVDLQAPRRVHEAWMWVLVGGSSRDPPYRIYNFRYNRSHKHAFDLLKDFRGGIHSDKFGAYETLAKKEGVNWRPCWAHIRRKFFDAASGNPKLRRWVLRKIHYLYVFDNAAWERSPEERLRIRHRYEVPIIDDLIAQITKEITDGAALPKSKWRQALMYFCGLIPHLKNYTKDPNAQLDNNVAERAVRPLAIGRKNWLFVGSEAGGDAAAVLLSIVQTCRGLKINPYDYLEDVMRRLQGHSYSKLHELLPDEWAASRKEASNS